MACFCFACKVTHIRSVQGSGKSYSLGQRIYQWLDQEEDAPNFF